MDVLDQLMAEHRRAEHLMADLERAEPGDHRSELLADLGDALTTHMAVEEQFLYPIVRDVLGPDTEAEADAEHVLAREALATLAEEADGPAFNAALDMVKAGIKHHVDEEEQEVFPQLRQKAADQLAKLDPAVLEAEVVDDQDEDDEQDQDETHASTGSALDLDVLSRDELYQRAKAEDIPGRSSMNKEQLAEALHAAG